MRALILKGASSRTLKVVLAVVAMAAALDDVIELWSGLADIFHLDVAHGVFLTGLTGILDPLCEFIEDNDESLKQRLNKKTSEGE